MALLPLEISLNLEREKENCFLFNDVLDEVFF